MTRPVTRSRRSWAMRASHYIRNHKPGIGAYTSRNMGIAMSQGEIVAILDDDVTAPSDWMANIVTEFDADPDLQFICGKLTAPPFDWRTEYVPTFDPENTSEPLTKWTMPIFAAGANSSTCGARSSTE